MKKYLLLAFLFLFFLFTPSVLAQNFDSQKAYEDYVFQKNEYDKAHAEYELARAAYLQSGTLAAKSEAQAKTMAMLVARDEVLRTYLTAIRLRLVETRGLLSTEKEPLFGQIDSEVSWYENHKNEVGSAGSLEDLVTESDEARDRFEETTQDIAYRSLFTVSKGKVSTYQIDLRGIITDLETKIAQVRSAGDKETRDIERWMLDTRSKLVRSEEKLLSAQGEILDLGDRSEEKLPAYNKAIFTLEESFQALKEGLDFMKQVIRELKTAD